MTRNLRARWMSSSRRRTRFPRPVRGPVGRDAVAAHSEAPGRTGGISFSFPESSKAYAIQAGREIRVIVENEEISDADATMLNRDIARKIENELSYPGRSR